MIARIRIKADMGSELQRSMVKLFDLRLLVLVLIYFSSVYGDI